jgi:hypothetical protein
VYASPCVAFDVNWNLLAFGLDGKDWSAGTQGTWASGASRLPFFRSLGLCVDTIISSTFGLVNPQAPPPILPLPLVVREFCLCQSESIRPC